jgi:hypothetical protein
MTMRAHDSSARTFRPGDSTGLSLPGPIRGRRAHALSRRDLLRAGAAGLVGLGLPIAAPLRAFAGTCFPGGNILYTGGSEAKPNNPIVQAGLTVDPPTLQNGNLCVTGVNNTPWTLVLVWNVLNAPNANLFNCFTSDAFLQDETLMQISTCVVPPSPNQFTCCVPVPNVCFQGDLGVFQRDPVLFQGDLGVYTSDQVAQNPGLIGIPIQLSSDNIVAGFLMGGNCQQPACCIRMTGGGGTVLTLGGISVSTKAGFQLRSVNAGGHSNLELHWTDAQGVAHVFKVGPQDSTNFTCAFTPCPGGGGGGQPLNSPNTILGTATGSLDGQPANIFLSFVDCGEPGTNDTRTIAIVDSQGVFQLAIASGTIQNGNNQAHSC